MPGAASALEELQCTEEQLRILAEDDPELLLAALKEWEESGVIKRAFVDACHPKQRALLDDPSKIIVSCCSRRAGKSEANCAWELDKAFEVPGGLSLYVMLTRNNCRLTPWNVFQRLNDRYKLGLHLHEVDGQLMVDLPNEHRIWLAGCKNQGEVGKFRGVSGKRLGGYTRVVVDEAQNYGAFMSELVDDALLPGLMDQSGEMLLSGTPRPVPSGYFFDACMSAQTAGFGFHHWTWRDNPYLREPHAWIRNFMRLKGWGPDNPTYIREYEGRWIRDDDALVYPFLAAKNAFLDDPPRGPEWRYAMGVDIGFNEPTAFVVGCYRVNHPEILIVHAEKHCGLIPSVVAVKIEKLQKDWAVGRTIIDTGGAGKGYFEEMQQRYGLVGEPAKKTNKRAYQELLTGDLRSGVLKVHPFRCAELLDEWSVLQWDKEDPTIEDASFENHLSDAALYLHRAINATYRPELDTGRPPVSEDKALAIIRAKRRNSRSRIW